MGAANVGRLGYRDSSRYLLSHYEDDPSDFIERVVTQDETWGHYFDPESKMQNKQ